MKLEFYNNGKYMISTMVAHDYAYIYGWRIYYWRMRIVYDTNEKITHNFFLN